MDFPYAEVATARVNSARSFTGGGAFDIPVCMYLGGFKHGQQYL